MKIEHYFYSNTNPEMYEAVPMPQEQLMQENMLFSQDTDLPKQAVLEQLISEMQPLPTDLLSMLDAEKYHRFLALCDASIPISNALPANFQCFTEGMTGCISFLSDSISFTGERKKLLEQLVTISDEMHTALSVNTCSGSSTDIDGAVRLEFWFDFYPASE